VIGEIGDVGIGVVCAAAFRPRHRRLETAALDVLLYALLASNEFFAGDERSKFCVDHAAASKIASIWAASGAPGTKRLSRTALPAVKAVM
jgi:hypothetical protein